MVIRRYLIKSNIDLFKLSVLLLYIHSPGHVQVIILMFDEFFLLTATKKRANSHWFYDFKPFIQCAIVVEDLFPPSYKGLERMIRLLHFTV